jgi:hypothetical protein
LPAQHVHYEPLELSHDESHQSGFMLHHQMDVPSSQDCIKCHFCATSSISRFPWTCIAIGSSVWMKDTIGSSRGSQAASFDHHQILPRIDTLDSTLLSRVLS